MFASSRPAELILLRGAPVYQHVTGTILQWVSNTESDVFRVGQSGLIYYLVVGALVLGAGLHRTVDVCHADASGRLQEDSGRSPAIARARVGAWNRRRRRKRS